MTRREKKKRIMEVSVATLAFLLLVSLGLFFLHRWETRETAETYVESVGQKASGYLIYDGVKYAPKAVDTVLLIGIDKFAEEVRYDSYNNQQQADFLLLLVMDDEAKTCTPVQINRDTMAEVPVLSLTGEVIGTVEQQITLAHTYGSGREDSCENVVWAVRTLLGEAPVEHYISTTMDTVQIVNDLVGGVTVTVEDDFTGIDDTLILGQQVNLLGKHALTFVRSRSGLEDGTNLNRMARQRQYMDGLRLKVVEKMGENPLFTLDALAQVGEYLVSDCTITQLTEIANDVLNYKVKPTRQLRGSAVVGEEYMEYYMDPEALEGLLVELFYKPVE